MKINKHILISVLSLILCILVSFAWINELQNPMGRVLALRFNDAAIANSELEVRLAVNVDDDKFEDITKLREDDSDSNLESYSNFAPGSRKKFRVDIKNLSNSSVTLRVFLSDIICENTDLQDHIILGTNGFDGFDSNYPAPAVQTKRLSDGMDDVGGFVLVDSVEIPPHGDGESVSIYFYIIFAASGSEDLENTSFSIGTINFLTL